MGKLVFTNGQLLVNGVDLSDHVVEITVEGKAADVESTTMGALAKQRLPGLRDESIKVKFRQDFAAAKVDQTLAALYTGGTSFAIEARPVNGARSTTNPGYTGTAYLLEYQPVAGQVGAIMDADVTFVIDNGLTRQTA